ncbi:sensor histidine kinase [Pseudonocardia abyssalis]|uniref:Sensor-like histidine kinase SenX3 n=1 Tax=Pseudonocardia abyssalis TaxID=2792008 RepID=A0ABS6UNT5_9PSEU|nr:HAMP domain-containing sensor histidine kinase [Pseudonocardia abyssalis]MBW0118469.1 HAMP domain-containing histidine kinase [Pseudonocardia abyssalis]MBW0133910.1 HAMP domain-containing histidine kinase [Pseudonocardia abyssalis]
MNRGDRVVLRRAWWRSVVQIAVGTTAVLLLTGGVALLLVNEHQSETLDAELTAVLAVADDVDDPPPGSYLAHAGADGRTEVTPAAPPGVAAALTAAANGTVDDRHDVDTPEGTYRLEISDRETGRWVIANDLAALRTDQRRVLEAVLLAEATGLAAALAAAALLSRRSVQPLAEALELQRRFVADASHELRAPLTVLFTRAQMLAAHPAASVDPDLAEGLHGLVTDTRALGEVVEDLLVSAELDRQPERDHVVDLDDLAAGVVASTCAHAAARGVSVTHDPDPAGPHPVNGHAVALRRAILALVDNAIGHTPEGGHVRITVTGSAGSVALTVADDGIGIDPGRAEELFARSRHDDHGTTRRFGLGLALVRETARNHHGTVTADGAPGRGARFTLSLPRP